MPIFLPGYAGPIWTTLRSTLSYASTNINPDAPQQTKALARAVVASLKNGSQAIEASQTYSGLQQLYAQLAQLLPLNLSLDSATYAFVVNRVTAIQAATLSLKNNLVLPLNVQKQLSNNQPTVPDPGYMEWLYNFSFETPPSAFSSSPTTATLVAQAQAAADAWQAVATSLRQNSLGYTGSLYSTVLMMNRLAQTTATIVANATIPSNSSAASVWNKLVAAPAITKCCSAIVSDPTSITAQQTAVIRYVISQAMLQYNKLIVSLREVVTAQLRLGTLRMNDTLMTFANRELSNYSAWRQIAQLNGLEPPYVGTVKSPNIAVPGQQLFLPPPNSSTTTVPEVSPVANYIINYLGVDKYLGPLNQPMLPWTGDDQIISGYSNLALSLGRRLQTTVGLLMYHPTFGSRIPPEVGSIIVSNVAGLLVEYTKSALLSDPRVNTVTKCTATLIGTYAVEINAVVLPNGLGQEEITVNEVIGPA